MGWRLLSCGFLSAGGCVVGFFNIGGVPAARVGRRAKKVAAWAAPPEALPIRDDARVLQVGVVHVDEERVFAGRWTSEALINVLRMAMREDELLMKCPAVSD